MQLIVLLYLKFCMQSRCRQNVFETFTVHLSLRAISCVMVELKTSVSETCFTSSTQVYRGAHGGVVVKALRYKPAGRACSIPDGVIGIFQ